ncbi:YeeE/YedE thiosulfate transporter family protein [Persephonella sp.]
MEEKPVINWFWAGTLLAVVNLIVFIVEQRPIGASTAFPYLGNLLFPVINNEYLAEIEKSGRWELWFLAGGFFGAVVTSLITKTFRFTVTPVYWEKRLKLGRKSRVAFAFLGGFLLIFGARMAGGCTSGHMFSGGMQLAVSSLWFGIFAFAGGLMAAHLIYKRRYS